MSNGSEKLEIERLAETLHRAVRKLRDLTCMEPGIRRTLENNSLVWALYIHIGVLLLPIQVL